MWASATNTCRSLRRRPRPSAASSTDASRTRTERSLRAHSPNRLLATVFASAAICSPAAYNAADLPAYKPEAAVSGVIRNYGFGFGGLLKIWEEGFRKHHPDAAFKDVTITSDAAFPALVTGVTDLAPDGGEPAITEWLSFYETYGYHATDIVVASGTYDVDGRSPGVVVYVHPHNPIPTLTLHQ